MSKKQVLSLLYQAGEGYISGQSISQALGVTRAAVWKDIDALRRDGYEIDSAPRKGYRLISAPDDLTEESILPHLRTPGSRERLIMLETVDSTNTYAKQLALADGQDSTPIVANHQTGGRGRLGRSFLSPPNTGIYLTMLYRPQVPPMEAVNLTAYVAVAVCRGIEAACGAHPGIKWTNDIVLGNRKLAGILTEMAVEGETGALQYLVTGIGINVLQQQADFPEELHSVATSLAMEGYSVRRSRLAAEVINALEEMYQHWLHGTGDYWQEYRSRCLTLGREVCILRGGQSRMALAWDLDRDFGLRVLYPDGQEETVTAGEVSVRGLFGYV